MITWIHGNSGAGKTTIAKALAAGRHNALILDGDEMRAVWPGLGFSRKDREEQNLRIARLAKNLENQGAEVIIATICPYRDLRARVQEITGCRFVYVEGGRAGKEYPYEK